MKYLIFGLGNIGAEYVNTRHNIGFEVVDSWANMKEIPFEPGRYASVARLKFKGRTMVLLKPATYMNLSGKAVRYWMETEKVPVERILVIVDDLALPLGTLRMKLKGGDGGHNGLTSIIMELGSESFPRLRFGIGDDFSRGYQVDHVLGKWTKAEEEVVIPRIKTAIQMIQSFATIGPGRTMTMYNNK